ncbi:MAG: 30S ribosomal protein S6 [Candidatus Magasanikbacteria bacterium]
MKYYEMLCVLPGTMTEEEVKSNVDVISSTVAKHGAEKLTVEDMGKSRLAYPVKHIRYGYFQLFRFNLEENKINNLEKEVRLLDKMLRISIVISDPANVVNYKLALDPTALSAPQKGDRDEQQRPNRRVVEEVVKEKNTEEVVEKTEVEVVKEEVVEVKVEKPTKKSEKTKMSVEDIDKKLDEILLDDMGKI